MKAALLILVVAAAAVAVPVQWLELEKAATISKGPARLGDIYKTCSESSFASYIDHIICACARAADQLPLYVLLI